MMQELEERAAERIMRGLVYPIPQDLPREGISLGNATDLYEEAGEVRISEKSLEQHVGVFGCSGSGKSWFVSHIIAQLIHQGFPVTVIDVEGEYGRLLPMFPRERLNWFRHDWIKINLFQPGDGKPESIEPWMGKIGKLLWSNLYLGDGSYEILLGLLWDLYLHRGCLKGSGHWPSLAHLIHRTENLEAKSRTRRQGYQETLLRALKTVMNRLGSSLNVVRSMPLGELRKRSAILDVSELDSQSLELFLCLFLEATAHEAEVPRVVVLEEAHVLLNQNRQKREAFGEPPMQEALRRCRKRGTYFILVDQSPGQLPQSTIANLGTKVVFPLMHFRDLETVAASMGLNRDQVKQIHSLPKRVGVVQNQELGTPVLFKVPELDFPEAPPLAVREQEMQPILSKLRWVGPADEKPGGLARPGPEVEVPIPPDDNLSWNALDYLRKLNDYENRFLPLTAFDKKHGIPGSTGNGLRNELIDAKAIAIQRIKTGKRGHPIETIEILRTGFAILKQRGIQPKRYVGRGTFDCKFWAVWICRYLVKVFSGCKPEIEKVREGKAADVAVEINGILRAYEIQLSTKHVSENLFGDLNAGFDEVVFCALTQRTLDTIKEKLEKELGPGEDAEGMRGLKKKGAVSLPGV